MTKYWRSLVMVGLVVCLLVGGLKPVSAQEKVFTVEQLSQYDGLDGRAAYYAYEGVVYDVTESALWKLGKHFGHQAGQDLTGKLEGAPHGDEIVKAMPVVGRLAGDAGSPAQSPAPVVQPSQATSLTPATQPTKAWYASPIRIMGLSILGWTGILLGVVFVLNFATCFAMPWNRLPLPWAGSRPGPDKLDSASAHKPFTSLHKPLAWATVILGVIHGVLGLLQVWGVYL